MYLMCVASLFWTLRTTKVGETLKCKDLGDRFQIRRIVESWYALQLVLEIPFNYFGESLYPKCMAEDWYVISEISRS